MPMGEAQLDDLLKDLRVDVFAHMVENADSLYADITIPRFSIDYQSDMNALFGRPGSSKILREVLMSDRMFEDKVPESSAAAYFRALIQNDVDGSFTPGTGHHHHLDYTSANSILIDRPFLFLVRERHTNAILFFGVLRNPNAQ
jgi:serpin B